MQPGMDVEILNWSCVLQMKATQGHFILQECPALSRGLARQGQGKAWPAGTVEGTNEVAS